MNRTVIYILTAVIVIFLIWLFAFSNRFAPTQSVNQGTTGESPTGVVSPTEVPTETPIPSSMVSPSGTTPSVSPKVTMTPTPSTAVSVTPSPTQ